MNWKKALKIIKSLIKFRLKHLAVDSNLLAYGLDTEYAKRYAKERNELQELDKWLDNQFDVSKKDVK